jgi:hypothetical protein
MSIIEDIKNNYLIKDIFESNDYKNLFGNNVELYCVNDIFIFLSILNLKK